MKQTPREKAEFGLGGKHIEISVSPALLSSSCPQHSKMGVGLSEFCLKRDKLCKLYVIWNCIKRQSLLE